MRFLIDPCLSTVFAEALAAAGHDIVHVRYRDMQSAGDPEVLQLARSEDRLDFGTILARTSAVRPSIVIFRRASGRRPIAEAALLLANLALIPQALDAGSVVVLEEARLRVRRLPIIEWVPTRIVEAFRITLVPLPRGPQQRSRRRGPSLPLGHPTISLNGRCRTTCRAPSARLRPPRIRRHRMRPLAGGRADRAAPPGLGELRRRRCEILAVAAAHGASNVRVFGSVARGEQGNDSDLDLIVDLDDDRSLFDLGGLAFDLEQLLGCAIDVGLDDSFGEAIRDQVLAEAVAL